MMCIPIILQHCRRLRRGFVRRTPAPNHKPATAQMSLYNGPPRPGARGGRAEFSWDNVKADKDREYYLGHSVKASVGRWQKGKDIFWYNKGKGDMGVSRDEIEAVKEAERQAMAEALGLKVKAPASNKLRQQPSLEKHEVDKLLRGASGDQQPEAAAEGDRIAGLGFRAGVAVAVREEVHEVLQGMGLPSSSGTAPGAAAEGGGGIGGGDGGGGPGLMTAEQLAALAKLDTAAAAAATTGGKGGRKNKKEKKDKKDKKDKKKRKKEHKDKKQKSKEKSKRRRSSSSSSDNSSSSNSDVDSQDRHRTSRHRQVQQGGDRYRQQQQTQQHMPAHSEQRLQQQQHLHRERPDRGQGLDRRASGHSSRGRHDHRPGGGQLQQRSEAAAAEGSSRQKHRSPSPLHQHHHKQQHDRRDDEDKHRWHDKFGRQNHGRDHIRSRSPVQQRPSSSSRRGRDTGRSRSRSPLNGREHHRSRH